MLEAGPPARLLDSATGRSIVLSETEAMLLEFWDGTSDTASVVRAAQEASLRVDPYQAAIFLTRLGKSGFLAVAPSASALSAASAPNLGPNDVAPSFREDLELTRLPEQYQGMQVKDPLTGKSFTLYDFELSIARMLDGKRTMLQVVEAAITIGIPVSLGSLNAFLDQLRGYQFITGGASAPAGPPPLSSTWTRRAIWKPEVRVLFQKALKLSREERPLMALPLLDEILRLQPNNEEARALRARVEATRAAAISIDVDFEELHGDEATSVSVVTAPLETKVRAPAPIAPRAEPVVPQAAPAFQTARAVASGTSTASATSMAAPDAAVATKAATAAAAVTTSDASVEIDVDESAGAGDEVREALHSFDVNTLVSTLGEHPPKPSRPPPPSHPAQPSIPIPIEEINRAISRAQRRRVVVVLVCAVVALLVASLLRPVPWRGRVGCRLTPTEVSKVKLDGESLVLSLEQKDGAAVKKGDLLATLELALAKERLAQLESRLDEARKSIVTMESEPCDPAVRQRVEAKVAVAQRDVDFIRRDQRLAAEIPDPGRRERTIKVLEPIALQRLEALAAVQAEHEQLTMDMALAKAKADEVELSAELEAARADQSSVQLVAPEAGLMLWSPGVAVGKRYPAGTVLGTLLSRVARVEAEGPFPEGADLPVPEAKLNLEVVKIPLDGEAWTFGPEGRRLVGKVEVRDPALFRKPQLLELDFGKRRFWQALRAPAD